MKDFIHSENHFSEINHKVFGKVRDLLSKVENTPQRKTGIETWFFRSDTGTGKSQGYIRHIADSNATYANALPTNKMVLEIYKDLKAAGVDVGYWFSKCGHNKSKVNRVFVGTHKYLLSDHNPERQIGSKDILIIDETPKEYKGGQLTVSDFRKAEELAVGHLPIQYHKRFAALSAWASRQFDKQKDQKGVSLYEPQAYNDKFGDIPTIWESVKSVPTEEDRQLVRRGLDFLVAADESRAFYRLKGGKENAQLDWCFYDFRSKGFKKHVVFSATCNLDGFQYSPDDYKLRDSDGVRVSYENMEFLNAPWPYVSKRVLSTMSTQESRNFLEYIVALLGCCNRGQREKFLLVLPKRLREDLIYTVCQSFCDLAGDDILAWDDDSGSFTYLGNQVLLTNWGADVGSNDYRECSTVILFHNNYVPSTALMSDYLHFSEQESKVIGQHVKTNGTLGDTVRGYQQERCEGALKQMAMRGSGRQIQADGACGVTRIMTAWFSVDADLAQRVFPGSRYKDIPPAHPRFAPQPKSKLVLKVATIADSVDEMALKDLLGRKVTTADRKSFEKEGVYLGSLGWQFVGGQRGNGGRPARLVRVKPVLFGAPNSR